MKRLIYTITGIIVLLVAASCTQAEDQQVKKVGLNDSLRLSDSDLEAAKKKALEGDAESAFQIYSHYALGKFDTVSSFVWLEIAANHGKANAQFNLGYLYTKVSFLKNLRLARFWLKEAEKNGSTSAPRLLKMLEESESKKDDIKLLNFLHSRGFVVSQSAQVA
jgi:TPR repeat protein